MLLYAITIFLSAFLLFQVQPLIAKMILPWFGGSAAVWATCLLFFQSVLLAGYGYSHGISGKLKPRRQWMLHAALLAVGAVCVAVWHITPDAAWKPADPGLPVVRILALLAVTVGLPYFLLSTTGPLIQAWFVQARPGQSPYRLYALSNVGSMLALLSYPLAIEPALTLRAQSLTWSAGFLLFAVLCVWTGWRSQGAAVAVAEQKREEEEAPAPPTLGTRLFWVALAACPSMLLLALSTHMSMDVAPIPFLWILPLALYLLTFILCFDAQGWYRRKLFLVLLPFALGVFAFPLAWLAEKLDVQQAWWTAALGGLAYLLPRLPGQLPPVVVTVALFCVQFFVCCMVCHGELTRLKPHPRYLTGYFLMISVGGAIGGVFVAMFAPVAFNAYHEFPIAVGLCAVLALAVLYREKEWSFGRDLLGWPSVVVLTLALALFGYLGRVMREAVHDSVLVTRNFYGELKVRQSGNVYDWDGFRTLVHGSINHGEQYTHPARRKEPVTYYCPDSGVGRFMSARIVGTAERVAVVGLGTGTLAAYGRPGDAYRFYEINPKVPQIANEQFTYLKDSDALVDVALGDARLTLERERPQNYDLIAVDAFSSDSIPVHLLTKEALALYFRHLKPSGVLAIHISNRYINLQPVLERGASALGKTARVFETDENEEHTCYATTWVLMSADASVFNKDDYKMGRPLVKADWLPVWTDDYSNLYKVLR